MPHTPSGDSRTAEELREEIERTRERLGATVEQLVARTDVKRRAKAEAARLAGRVKASAAPDPVRRAVAQGSSAVRRHRGPALAAACVLVTAVLFTWRWRNR
jgi:ferric-dicitrate binding protein FerR (iron transport regulator)